MGVNNAGFKYSKELDSRMSFDEENTYNGFFFNLADMQHFSEKHRYSNLYFHLHVNIKNLENSIFTTNQVQLARWTVG